MEELSKLIQNPRIGLLGGSFNPAHSGHVYISQRALELLELDEVWWLVSPQSPMKETIGMASFEERFRAAQNITEPHPQIKISDFEYNLVRSISHVPERGRGAYTYDTLLAITSAYPNNNFVWLMGADNLLQFSKWYKWQKILTLIPIVVFSRGGVDKETALSGELAREFAAYKIEYTRNIKFVTLPAWVFLDIEPNPISSTILREGIDLT